MANKHHITHRKKRSHRRKKRAERKVLLIAAPIIIATALGISLAITGMPKLYRKIARNIAREMINSTDLIRGSAVRQGTDIRKLYEKRYRDKTNKNREESYKEILENTDINKIKELEKKYRKLKELEKHQ